MTPSLAVAVVGADTPGNVGTVARAMKNFGVEDLLLVDPPPLDPDGEAYGFAGRAREDVLPNHVELEFDELVAGYHTVAFTATPGDHGGSPTRFPFCTPDELVDDLRGVTGPVALVFGRERTGLTNDELGRLDQLCSIPASPAYPTLNLGQAATIALYALRELTLADTQHPADAHDLADPAEVEAFYRHATAFLGELGYPDGKRETTLRLLRRLVGRARPTGRELVTLRGVLRRIARAAEVDPDAVEPAEPEAPPADRDS